MATNQNHFTPSNKKEIFEILSGVNYKFRQIGSIHTEGMGLYFDDKSKEPKWHISIHSSNDGYELVYSEFSDKENEWVRKDEQTCGSFNDVLSTLKLYKKELDNLGLEKAPQQKPIYFKYAICNSSNSWYLTKTNEFDYFYCPQDSDYYEMRKLFLNSLALFDTAEEAKEYVYQNKKDVIRKNTVDIIQIKIEDESHYHFGRKSIIHIKNYNEDIDEYDMEIDGIDLYYNNNIIGQLGIAKDRKYNGEVALVSNLSKRFIQSVMHYLYSTLRGVEWKKPTILSSPIEDKYFGYNPSDIYTDDIDVVYGSKTIGYCGTKDRHFTGEIRFKDGVDENLKKAVLYKFNNSSLYNDIEWREVGKMKESIKKLTENLLDRPFIVNWTSEDHSEAIVKVEGLKDIYIKVGKNFRIDLRKYEEYGKRQITYLESHRYDISEKLMELSGMSNDQIQVCLEKLKAEKGISCTSFLSEFKPKYQNFNSEFCSFVRRHHLDSNDDDCFYTFAIEDLKESWENFYTGGDGWADKGCLFYPAMYLYKMDKNDVVDHEKWDNFMTHSSGGHRLEDGYYYTLQDLDEAFEKFESSLGKVEESTENKLKEKNMNKSSKTIQWLDYSIPEDKPYVLFEVDDYSNVVKVLGTFDTWDKAFEYRKTLNNEYRGDTDIVDVRDDDLYNEKPRSEHYGDYIDAVVRTKLGQGRIVDYNEGSCQPYKVTITHPFNGGEEGYSDWYSEDEIEFLYSSTGKVGESIKMNKIKESKNIFPCTIYMVNQDWDEETYYYLDTPDYGLAWQFCDDVEQEEIENYKYIIKNIANLRTAIRDLKETFIDGYGDKYFKLSKNYMEELLNRGETLVRSFNSNVDDEDRIFMIKIEPVQNLELTLAESFEKTFKDLQKEGLFENVKSFDLELKENKLNIKLNEDEYIPEYPFIEAYFDIIEHRDLWSRIHYNNHTWDEINSKLGEMGCEQFLAKYFDSPETIESMNWETLANIKTEDGQNIMDLLADKFEDIVDYALEDDEIDYRDYSDDDDYDDDDYDEDCREHHRMMYGY